MHENVKILVLDSGNEDPDAWVQHLLNQSFSAEFHRVHNSNALREALKTGAWDLIVSAQFLDGWSAFEVLSIVAELGLEIPCVVVSGREEAGDPVALMNDGAQDFLLESELDRLTLILQREIRAAKNRRKRRRIERALQESQAHLQRVVQSNLEAILTVDQSQSITLVNPAAERLFRNSAGELLGQPIHQVLIREMNLLIGDSSSPKKDSNGTGEVVLPKVSGVHHYLARRQDGELFPVEASISYTALGEGGLTTIVLRDVAERDRLEKQLRQAQRMEAIGQLSGGIARELLWLHQ